MKGDALPRPPRIDLSPTNIGDLICRTSNTLSFSFDPPPSAWAFASEWHFREFVTCLDGWLACPFTNESFELCRAELQNVIDRAWYAGVLETTK